MAGPKERPNTDPEAHEDTPQSPLEIERKFLLDQLPDLEGTDYSEIKQGYLGDKSVPNSIVRVRQQGSEFFLTLKSGTGMTREEIEAPIPGSMFERLWPGTEGWRLEKTRYSIPHDDSTIFVDEYKGDLKGLVTAEIEFIDENEARRFSPPAWMGVEITNDFRYSNVNLAEDGRPEEYCELEDGIAQVVDTVCQQAEAQTERNVVLNIAGGSASGKSYHAKTIRERLASLGVEAATLSCDNYYIPDEEIVETVESTGLPNWDTPQAINFDAIKKDIQKLATGESVPARINLFDGRGGIEIEGEVEPKKVIIVEGLHALNNQLKDTADTSVFFNVSSHGRMIRRLTRDIQRTPMQGSAIMRYIDEVVDPTHAEHVESTKTNADFVINNDYRPEEEFEGIPHTQQKLRVNDVSKNLEVAGAELISSTHQEDLYFHPQENGIDFERTDESMRIRKEGIRNVFGYKGPHIPSTNGSTRHKIEIMLDDQTTAALMRRFGDSIITVRKDRTHYRIGNVSVTLDTNVQSEKDGHVRDLGDFVELRSTEKDPLEAQDNILEVRKILNIPEELESVNISYAKMSA